MILRLVTRYLRRRPGRTLLTLLGVASAMLLFTSIESLSAGLDRALSGGDTARTLIVYRANRYCPQTSFLPERYAREIEEIPAVESVLPVKVFLNNCRASLDLVTFHGTPIDLLFRARDFEVVEGDPERFRREEQSALVGRAFSERRGLGVGDRFQIGGITVDVAGIFASPDPVEENVVLSHLEFLQRSGPVDRLGTVTQFEVKVKDTESAPAVAQRIDEIFRTAEEPTDSRPRLQFLTDATRDLRELLGFGRIFGLVCIAVVLVLVANTVLMAVQERRRDFGVYLTLGYEGRHLLGLVLGETLLLTLAGAIVGLLAAAAVVLWSRLAIGVEGVTVTFALSPLVFLKAAGAAALVALLAAVVPAIRAARSHAVESLRAA